MQVPSSVASSSQATTYYHCRSIAVTTSLRKVNRGIIHSWLQCVFNLWVYKLMIKLGQYTWDPSHMWFWWLWNFNCFTGFWIRKEEEKGRSSHNLHSKDPLWQITCTGICYMPNALHIMSNCHHSSEGKCVNDLWTTSLIQKWKK